ncbi:AbrB/MazE/SpoVT family DNA-binding domain-containing protein [Geomobilimonas luticola]|uniref:AbrB/MazE/SpoVT family DNA-binding domain-containing protein n=1 Tax=Geomobilimonas luticola TaxID=1114878 RepID=A0ABS5SBF3_9BACT|nr:AbrB/MazE/SpoVT family DNA-binding domain-containing protein [Geomobilimonas luticola]MBT0652699.1 AbrB/MazE/SpoVT family DNA-binding domain-containing protein [Geomobilimonas luticola]
MKAARSCVTEIRQRGQLTIPKNIREASRLEEGQEVSIIPLGDSILVTPKRLELDEARRQIRTIIRATGLAADDVLAGLEEERAALFEELYGKKTAR